MNFDSKFICHLFFRIFFIAFCSVCIHMIAFFYVDHVLFDC